MTIDFRLLLLGAFSLAHISQSFGQINSDKLNDEIDSVFGETEQYSLAAWNYSFIGEYQKSLIAYDKTGKKDHSPLSETDAQLILSKYKAQPAVEYIVERSKKEQIIVINEAHHQPLHRVFTESILRGLYENGYRYLGLEALAEDSLLNIRKWPKINDGYYTNEPQFGNLIREALGLGFTVFGYESTEKGKAREVGQASNILKVLEKDPDAKILIHCGFGHVVENNHPTLGKAMTGILHDLSGIDPFTIDQVEFSEHSHSDDESQLYRSIDLDQSSVLVDNHNQPLNYRSDSAYIDINVVHPRTQIISGRPNWLLRFNSWKEYRLKEDLIIKFPCIIAAYYQNEIDTESVPVDVIEVDFIHQKSLILPSGNFILHIVDRTGKIEREKITVFK